MKVGYIQTIALDYLEELALSQRWRVWLAVCPGDFVTHGTLIAKIWPASDIDDSTLESFRSCISIARERDTEQDPSYGVRQIADIALRALSPAVNDPTTAVLCIGYLQAIFEELIYHYAPCAIRELDGDEVVLAVRYVTLKEYLQVLVEISRYAADNARVVLALLDALLHIARIMARRKIPSGFLTIVVDAVASPAIEKARTDLDRTFLKEAQQHTLQSITTFNTGQSQSHAG